MKQTFSKIAVARSLRSFETFIVSSTFQKPVINCIKFLCGVRIIHRHMFAIWQINSQNCKANLLTLNQEIDSLDRFIEVFSGSKEFAKFRTLYALRCIIHSNLI